MYNKSLHKIKREQRINERENTTVYFSTGITFHDHISLNICIIQTKVLERKCIYNVSALICVHLMIYKKWVI